MAQVSEILGEMPLAIRDFRRNVSEHPWPWAESAQPHPPPFFCLKRDARSRAPPALLKLNFNLLISSPQAQALSTCVLEYCTALASGPQPALRVQGHLYGLHHHLNLGGGRQPHASARHQLQDALPQVARLVASVVLLATKAFRRCSKDDAARVGRAVQSGKH